MVQTRTDAAAQQKVWDMIRDVEIAMMVTMDEEGRFRSRPMRAVKQEFNGTLWFFTKAGSPKTDELKQDERTLLAYSDPKSQNYVSIGGTARIVRDVAKQKDINLLIEQELVKDAFSITIFQFPQPTAVSNQLTGVSSIPLAPTYFWNFWEWKLA